MTIAVLWYREKYDELWCQADSRISNSGKTTTDSGAKIFPIPISCYKQTSLGEWIEYDNFKIGFAFAGSTLAALNSLALVSACTQNLRINHGENKIPTIESVADLFKKITEFYIRDISTRSVGTQMSPKSFFFMPLNYSQDDLNLLKIFRKERLR